MAINRLNHEKIILMYGFQNYPTQFSDINFKKLKKIMKLYPKYDFGYADHSGWDEANNIIITLAGYLQDVSYIEKHITTDYGKERTDGNSAVSIEMFNEIVDKIDILEQCIGNGKMELSKCEIDYSIFGPMKKAGILKVAVKAGEKHKFENIIFKRVKEETDISQIEIIQNINSKYSTDLPAGTILFKKNFI